MIGEAGGKAVVSSNGEAWHARRRSTQHLFSLSQAKASTKAQQHHHQKLFAWLDKRLGSIQRIAYTQQSVHKNLHSCPHTHTPQEGYARTQTFTQAKILNDVFVFSPPLLTGSIVDLQELFLRYYFDYSIDTMCGGFDPARALSDQYQPVSESLPFSLTHSFTTTISTTTHSFNNSDPAGPINRESSSFQQRCCFHHQQQQQQQQQRGQQRWLQQQEQQQQ